MIAVIDVCGNNLSSITNALNRLDKPYCVTHDPEQISRASQVILPGVGTASFAMQGLAEFQLPELLKSLTQPLLGICVGMQLLLEQSAEGNTETLGIIPGTVELLEAKPGCPVPHMGWNRLQWSGDSLLRHGIKDEDYVYFVHSYAVKSLENAVAQCAYTEKFSAIIQRDNFFGMQFHPEKSGQVGLQLLQNFCNL